MLWKKESRQPDALYIDIFTPNTQLWDSIVNSKLQTIQQTPHPTKSDVIALKKRNEGNVLFRDSAMIEAMTLYSDSLRFASPGSEHISRAYANRSACFLEMKMYDECLIDIEYAMAAGYPKHLRPKLFDRMARCIKEMQDDPQYPHEKLSIEPDEKYPCLSNVVKVKKSGDNGDSALVAKTDIDVGQPIIIESPFYIYVRSGLGIYCNICAKECGNLVPCEKCAVAMFCPECQGHFLHKYECGLNFCEKSELNSNAMDLLRSILLAFKLFPTTYDLMAFVEQMLKRPNELPESMLDDRSKYRAYFNSPIKRNMNSPYQMGLLIYPVYKTLLCIPHVNVMFRTTKQRRFLMHLIGHHAMIPQNVAGFSLNAGLPSPTGAPVRVSSVMHSYFKHSCYPNVRFISSGGKCHWYSVKPIQKGEQLSISHAPSRLNSTEERKNYLLEHFNIKCECRRCQGKAASSAQHQQLISDPIFQYIQKFNSKKGESNAKKMMDACVMVLQKYGQMDWCDEMACVLRCFRALYKIRSIQGGSDINHPLVRELVSRLII